MGEWDFYPIPIQRETLAMYLNIKITKWISLFVPPTLKIYSVSQKTDLKEINHLKALIKTKSCHLFDPLVKN